MLIDGAPSRGRGKRAGQDRQIRRFRVPVFGKVLAFLLDNLGVAKKKYAGKVRVVHKDLPLSKKSHRTGAVGCASGALCRRSR